MQVGSLIAYLDLDATNFDRKTKSANKQIDGLALNLEALGKLNPELKVKTDRLTTEIQAVKAQLADLKAKAAEGTDVRVETTQAMLKLAALKAEMRALHGEAAKSLAVNYDDSGLRKLSSDLDGISKKMKGLGSGGLFGTALAFGPALAPFGGAAVGALGGITAAATEAVSAVGVLALALKGVSGANSAYATYQTAMAKATTPKQRAAAQQNLNLSAYGKSSASTQQFVKFNQAQLHPFGAGLMSSAQAGVLPGLTAGLQSFIKDAPQVNLALKTIGGAVGHLMAEAGHALTSPFWKQWIVWFGHDSAKNVGTMGHAVGQLVEALARMDQRSGGAGKIVADVDHLATRLNNWSASPAFLSFLDHIRTDEAQASKFLKELWIDLAPILKGLSATGGAELSLLTGALSTISKLPTNWLVTAGRWLPVIFLSLKLTSGPLAGLTSGFGKATAAMAGFSEAGSIEKMSKLRAGFQGAMSGMAGAAGVGLLIDGVTRANGAISQLELTAGGALAGSAFGPFGALIGALAGEFVGLYRDATAVNDVFTHVNGVQELAKHYGDLASAIGNTTLKLQDNARQTALNDLQAKNKDGTSGLSVLQGLGFNTRQAIDVELHQGSSYKRAVGLQRQNGAALTAAQTTLSNFSNDGGATLAKLQATNFNGYGGAGAWVSAMQARIAALTATGNQLKAVLGALPAAIDQVFAGQVATVGSVNDGLLKTAHLAPAAFKAIESGGVDSIEKLKAVAAANGMKDWQIKIAFAAWGINAPKAEIDAIAAYAASHPATVPVKADTGGFWGPLWNTLNNLPAGVTAAHPTSSKPKQYPAHALGTNWASAGLALVGEQGRELVRLNTGDQVIPHARTEALLNARPAGSTALRWHPEDIRTLIEGIGDRVRGGTQNQIDNALAWGA